MLLLTCYLVVWILSVGACLIFWQEIFEVPNGLVFGPSAGVLCALCVVFAHRIVSRKWRAILFFAAGYLLYVILWMFTGSFADTRVCLCADYFLGFEGATIAAFPLLSLLFGGLHAARSFPDNRRPRIVAAVAGVVALAVWAYFLFVFLDSPERKQPVTFAAVWGAVLLLTWGAMPIVAFLHLLRGKEWRRLPGAGILLGKVMIFWVPLLPIHELVVHAGNAGGIVVGVGVLLLVWLIYVLPVFVGSGGVSLFLSELHIGTKKMPSNDDTKCG